MARILAYFEGPDTEKMPGWRPWLLLVTGGQRLSIFGKSECVARTAASHDAAVFRAGEWEADGLCCKRGFPPIRPEILERFRRQQAQFPSLSENHNSDSHGKSHPK